MIWPFEHSKEEPLAWPEKWPGLPGAKKRGAMYSIFLPAVLRDEFQTFHKKLGQKQAVLLDGRKWSVASRLPFPSEEQW